MLQLETHQNRTKCFVLWRYGGGVLHEFCVLCFLFLRDMGGLVNASGRCGAGSYGVWVGRYGARGVRLRVRVW